MQHKKLFLIIVVAPLMFAIGGCGGGSSSVSATTKTTSVILNWTAPTTNEYGAPLTDLAGYKVHFGANSRLERNSNKYENSVDAQCASCGCLVEENTACEYTLTFTTDAENGEVLKYYFAVTAYNSSQNESDFSNEVSKGIE